MRARRICRALYCVLHVLVYVLHVAPDRDHASFTRTGASARGIRSSDHIAVTMDTHAAASCAPKLRGSGLPPAHMAHTRAAKHTALNACMTRPVRMHAKGSVCFAQECMRAPPPKLCRRRRECRHACSGLCEAKHPRGVADEQRRFAHFLMRAWAGARTAGNSHAYQHSTAHARLRRTPLAA